MILPNISIDIFLVHGGNFTGVFLTEQDARTHWVEQDPANEGKEPEIHDESHADIEIQTICLADLAGTYATLRRTPWRE